MKKNQPAFGAVKGAGMSSLRARDAHDGCVGLLAPTAAGRRPCAAAALPLLCAAAAATLPQLAVT